MSRVEELEAQLDEALASRRAWMDKTLQARAEIVRLRGLLAEAAAALPPRKHQKLIVRLRQGAL